MLTSRLYLACFPLNLKNSQVGCLPSTPYRLNNLIPLDVLEVNSLLWPFNSGSSKLSFDFTYRMA